MLKKINSLNEDKAKTETILSSLVQSLCIRPSCTDVLMLHLFYVAPTNENKNKRKETNICDLLDEENYSKILEFIVDNTDKNTIEGLWETVLDYFIKKNINLNKNSEIKKWCFAMKNCSVCPVLLLISRVMWCFHLLKNKVMSKSIYIQSTQNVQSIQSFANKFLSTHTYKPSEYDFLCLFELSRNNPNINIEKSYYENWLYHASFSPYWNFIIKKYNGRRSNSKQKVVFKTEEDFENFCINYGYNTDEQTKETTDTHIGDIKYLTNKWELFQKKYNELGIYFPDMTQMDDDCVLVFDIITNY